MPEGKVRLLPISRPSAGRSFSAQQSSSTRYSKLHDQIVVTVSRQEKPAAHG